MNEEKQDRSFKGIWIPKEIWLSKELTLQEKVFLVEISSLDNENGCYANNQYFADFFEISTRRVTQVINALVKKKQVVSEIKNGSDRTLRLPPWKESSRAIEGKFQHSNIYNNTSNNNTNSIIESDDSKEELKQEEVVIKTNPIVSLIVETIKNSIKKKNFMYVHKDERKFANLLSRNANWKNLISTTGVSHDVLIDGILNWTYSDNFWNGKISSVTQFYYKWEQLVNQMKKEDKFKFEDQAKKAERDRMREEYVRQYNNSLIKGTNGK